MKLLMNFKLSQPKVNGHLPAFSFRPIALLLLAFQVLNAQPVLQWANGAGSTGHDSGDGIAVDANGNSYSVAYFLSTIDADPGPGVQNLSSAGSEDILIRKLDPNGNIVWAKRIGGTLHDRAINIKYDPAGFIYLVGEFSGTVDFNPGTGVFNKTAAGNTDIFILKLDLLGNFDWAVALGSTGADNCWSLDIDASGAIYAVGFFSGTIDFDPGPGTFLLSSGGGYVVKLDSSGSFVWAGDVGNAASTDIEVDGNGNMYVTGIFNQTADPDPGPSTFSLTSNGQYDFYVEKLDSVGNFCWAVGFGGSLFDISESMARDGAGNLYITGYFQQTVDFDPGIGTYAVTGPGYHDAFVLKLSPAGGFVWAKTWGSAAGEIGIDLELDSNSNVYVAGYFEDTLDFDPGAGIFSLPAAGIADAFIQKLDSAGNFINAMRLGGSWDDIALLLRY
ncbi:MAG: hypothetical protein IPP17_24610 [Bacteroidetes bacterium]|nr:hypothetical protein [Bacteroidota bacterium]